MPRRLISTGSPFEKAAGYSRAVIDGDFAFVAGTTGYDYATMTMPEGAGAQARNALASRCTTSSASSTTHHTPPSRGDTARSARNPTLINSVTWRR